MNRFIVSAVAISLGAGVAGASAEPETPPVAHRGTTASASKYRLSDLTRTGSEKPRHKFGVAIPIWFGAQATMRSSGGMNVGTITGNPATDARQDRFYADGFNRVNSVGNPNVGLTGPVDSFPRTTYFSFAHNSQFSPTAGPTVLNPGRLSLHAFDSLKGGYGNFGGNEIRPSVELFYRYTLLPRERWSLDLEVGLSWMSMGWKEKGVVSAEAQWVKDVFDTGTVDPRVNVGLGGRLPYVGPFDPQGGEPWIGSTPSRRVYTGNALVSGQRELNLDAYLFRFGPALSWQVVPQLDLGLQVGAILGWASSSVSYADQIAFQDPTIPTVAQSGSVSDDKWVLGLHSAVRATYHFNRRWDFFAEGRHMLLDTIHIQDPQRSAEVDLSSGFGAAFGIGFKF